MGDEWGETDTRFLYGALNALSLLHLMDLADVPKAVSYVQSCENFDGAYGVIPGAESHAGQVFTCIGALSIAGRLDLINKDRLGAWLSERQVEKGGFNGRPEKLPDSCYAWWVGSSLAMIDRLHWIDGQKLAGFVLQCQVDLTLRCLWGVRRLTSCRIPKMAGLLIDLEIWSMSITPTSAWRALVFLNLKG